MKNLSVLLMGAAIILSSCATEFDIPGEDVPQSVKDAFKAKYASATDVKWEVEKEEGHLVYEAEFRADGKKKEAEFKGDGTFVKEE